MGVDLGMVDRWSVFADACRIYIISSRVSCVYDLLFFSLISHNFLVSVLDLVSCLVIVNDLLLKCLGSGWWWPVSRTWLPLFSLFQTWLEQARLLPSPLSLWRTFFNGLALRWCLDSPALELKRRLDFELFKSVDFFLLLKKLLLKQSLAFLHSCQRVSFHRFLRCF